jgi:hypothetical protein
VSNNPDGIDVKDVQPWKQEVKLVTPVQASNKPDGIDVKDVQFKNVFAKLVNPVIP